MVPQHIEDKYQLIIDKNEILTYDILQVWSIPETITPNIVVFDGTWQKVSYRMSGTSPVTFDATLDFMVGNVISAFSSDVPSPPRNLKVTASAGKLAISFDRPTSVPNATNYPIKSYMVSYRLSGSNPTTYTKTVTADPANIATFNVPETGTLAAGKYYVSVRAYTDIGKGEKTETREVQV